MLSGTGRGRLPTRSAIARLDHGCVADLQYETRYAEEDRSALNVPVSLLGGGNRAVRRGADTPLRRGGFYGPRARALPGVPGVPEPVGDRGSEGARLAGAAVCGGAGGHQGSAGGTGGRGC